ncbi:MAG TPA: acetolactate synthase small subunit [Acidimicrobiaceae bacterium]|nr:acetolactate synthase small subunit [Actinomycetota bacterium]HAQ04034.1 acetolactate synthase small subunit [Acidimicrobiaceae bacterium]
MSRKPRTVKKIQPNYRTLVVTVDNKFGVLARVSGLFARRGVNIKSLAVAPTDKAEFSRITVDLDIELESVSLDQIIKQLDKLINVVEIRALDPDKSVERELMIVTVRAEASQRDELVDHLDEVGGKVLNIGTESMMLSLVETSSVIDDFESFLGNFGIVELQRTGRVALDSL